VEITIYLFLPSTSLRLAASFFPPFCGVYFPFSFFSHRLIQHLLFGAGPAPCFFSSLFRSPFCPFSPFFYPQAAAPRRRPFLPVLIAPRRAGLFRCCFPPPFFFSGVRRDSRRADPFLVRPSWRTCFPLCTTFLSIVMTVPPMREGDVLSVAFFRALGCPLPPPLPDFFFPSIFARPRLLSSRRHLTEPCFFFRCFLFFFRARVVFFAGFWDSPRRPGAALPTFRSFPLRGTTTISLRGPWLFSPRSNPPYAREDPPPFSCSSPPSPQPLPSPPTVPRFSLPSL